MYSRLNFLSDLCLLTYSQKTNISLLREKDFEEFPLGEVIFSPLSGKISIARKAQFACLPDEVGMSTATMPAPFPQKYPKAERASQAPLSAWLWAGRSLLLCSTQGSVSTSTPRGALDKYAVWPERAVWTMCMRGGLDLFFAPSWEQGGRMDCGWDEDE